MADLILPEELVSLVNHIELNKSDWWRQSIQRLILSIVWMANKPLSAGEITKELAEKLHVALGNGIMSGAIEELLKSSELVRMPDGLLKVSEKDLADFGKKLEDLCRLEDIVKEKFTTILNKYCSGLDANKTWEIFRTDVFIPVIREIGARTYELISGSSWTLPRFVDKEKSQ